MVVAKRAVLNVTTQQSRFHTLKQESASTEITVKDLSITIGNHEVLSHAQLQLHPGRHYVLVGRNGVGKSTLLRAIAEGLILPDSIRVLLLGQVEEAEDSGFSEAPVSPKETVLEHVLRSDKERERRVHEASRLSTAMDNVDDPTAMLKVYRELRCEQLERDVAKARHRASKTSGVRGLGARKTLTKLEEELTAASERLEKLVISNDLGVEEPKTVKEETQNAIDMLTDVQASLVAMDASGAEARARSTLDPTVTLIVVTHDRAFADGVADELLVLRNQSLETFKGNVSSYETARLQSYKYLSKMQAAQEKQKKHIQATIEQNIKMAKRSGDDKKLKQVSSRRKKLNERMGMEVSAKGTRFNLNRDRPGYHESLRERIEVPDFDPPPRMMFSIGPSDLRFPGALISLEDVDFDYSTGKMQTPVLRNININIHPGERVGIVGMNGSGKSTLVSLMTADARESTSSRVRSKGNITRHARAKIGLYSQQAVEELQNIASAEPGSTALSHLLEFTNGALSEQEARGILSSLSLVGKVASEVPIRLLSGGQKVRLALAKVLWDPPHLLILDEVTTHLDPDTIQALGLRLRDYQGAILLITHDRFFMRCVVEGELSRVSTGRYEGGSEEESDDSEDGLPACGVVYRLFKTRLKKLDGGMQQYEEMVTRLLS
ncbi:ABC transporter ATP-binding protein uup-1, partial [Aureobasidium melanogenum]